MNPIAIGSPGWQADGGRSSAKVMRRRQDSYRIGQKAGVRQALIVCLQFDGEQSARRALTPWAYTQPVGLGRPPHLQINFIGPFLNTS